MPTRVQTIESVSRAIELMDVLGRASSMSFTDIVQALGWPKSTVHRMLATLMEHGYVEKPAGTTKYCVGLKLLGPGV